VGPNDGAEPVTTAPQLLIDERLANDTLSQSAVLFWNPNSEKPERLGIIKYRRGHLILLIDLALNRDHTTVHEIARRPHHCPELIRNCVVHSVPPSS
jgi:hypothetical protein